jgi:proteasome regulatory subunit
LEIELDRVKQELRSVKGTPLIVGTIQEVCDSGTKAVVRNSNGMEFYISVPDQFREKIFSGSRVGLSQRSLSVIRILPDTKDSRATAMEVIERPRITSEHIGGLKEVIESLEETVVLPLTAPERFEKLGIEPPHGVLLYGDPGTGKTLLAKALANKTKSTFISLTASELVRKFIGEGSEIVRDVFKLAKEKDHAIIFIDELDAIAAERVPSSTGDREVQRTLMQLLSELDGFRERGNVKIIAATNRIDIIDPAILRPGRFDRIIEVPVPDLEARTEIFSIHSARMALAKDVDARSLAALTEGVTGAEIKSICTEAGMFALRGTKNKVGVEDFGSAISKVLGSDRGEDRAAEKMFA